jgi:hypothetical protein
MSDFDLFNPDQPITTTTVGYGGAGDVIDTLTPNTGTINVGYGGAGDVLTGNTGTVGVGYGGAGDSMAGDSQSGGGAGGGAGGAGSTTPSSIEKLFETLLTKATTPQGLMTGLGMLYSMFGGNQPSMAGYQGKIPSYTATRTRRVIPAADQYVAYDPKRRAAGTPFMGRSYFNPVTFAPKPAPATETTTTTTDGSATVTKARGGMLSPRYLRGSTDGMADKINTSIDGQQPARLSHGEFVIPADVVSHLGNGNSDAGADVLYKMMDRVRKARTGTKEQGKKINPNKFTPGGIAYAQGGEVKRFQTGGTSSANPYSASPYGSSSSAALSEWAGPFVTDLLGKGQALMEMPYEAYEGPLVAGESPLQSKYFTGLSTIGFPSGLGGSFTDTGIANKYMNPFMSEILAPQLQALQREGDIKRASLGPTRMQGGFGARTGLMDQQLNAELMRQKQQATGRAYEKAYETGLGQFNLEQQRMKDIAQMLGAAGAQERAIEQQGIDALKAQFEEEKKFPYAQVQFGQSLLQGLPIGTTQYTPNLTDMQKLMQSGEFATKFGDWLSKYLTDTGTTTGTTTGGTTTTQSSGSTNVQQPATSGG